MLASGVSKNLCLFHVLDGLCDGLSHFSGPSRAAIVFAERPEDPVFIYDPQDLLRGHEPKLKEIYLDSDLWRRRNRGDSPDQHFSSTIDPVGNLHLTGLISYGGRTRTIFHQVWFTEHHPDMCSIGPTERWLEHAVCLLSHDFTNQETYIGTSRYVLREYATHAIRDYCRDEMNIMFGWDVQLQMYPILDAILAISKTPEEGSWPRGMLVFVEPGSLKHIDFLIRFPSLERLDLKNHKHTRKLLLAVEHSDRKLVSDGVNIIGITAGPLPPCHMLADFRGGHGFLKLAGKPVCSFADGRFYSTTRKPNLVLLEEALIEFSVDPANTHILFRIVSEIVGKACDSHFGCSIIIDLDEEFTPLSGQQFEAPIDLREPGFLELAKSLAKLDGSIHIRADLHLHAFAVLMDGSAVPGENRARGARFNSALRFTARHPKVLVVVVSSDRPVSVIQGGMDLTAHCELPPFSECIGSIPSLADWVKAI